MRGKTRRNKIRNDNIRENVRIIASCTITVFINYCIHRDWLCLKYRSRVFIILRMGCLKFFVHKIEVTKNRLNLWC